MVDGIDKFINGLQESQEYFNSTPTLKIADALKMEQEIHHLHLANLVMLNSYPIKYTESIQNFKWRVHSKVLLTGSIRMEDLIGVLLKRHWNK